MDCPVKQDSEKSPDSSVYDSPEKIDSRNLNQDLKYFNKLVSAEAGSNEEKNGVENLVGLFLGFKSQDYCYIFKPANPGNLKYNRWMQNQKIT